MHNNNDTPVTNKMLQSALKQMRWEIRAYGLGIVLANVTLMIQYGDKILAFFF